MTASKANARMMRTLIWVVPAAVLMAVVLMALNAATAPPTAGTTRSTGARGTSLGDANAPVKIEIFSDFQCPHCRDFALTVEPQLFKDYVDTGKAQFTYKHFIVIGPDSATAGQAAECAAKQNKFWAFHDKLFDVQGTKGAFTVESFKKYAGDLGLDQTAFNKCFDSAEMEPKVRTDSEEAANRGVRSTPTTFINGVQVLGAQAYDVFKKTIDAQIKP